MLRVMIFSPVLLTLPGDPGAFHSCKPGPTLASAANHGLGSPGGDWLSAPRYEDVAVMGHSALPLLSAVTVEHPLSPH